VGAGGRKGGREEGEAKERKEAAEGKEGEREMSGEGKKRAVRRRMF
jgi:hypothetical protein